MPSNEDTFPIDFSELNSIQESLSNHPVYKKLDSVDNISIFMNYHVFAVWDFMSILKSLQQKITCVDVPWRPSRFDTNFVRMINDIVACEESDLDRDGQHRSHFEMYLKSMQELGVDPSPVLDFIDSEDYSPIPTEIASFVKFNLDISKNTSTHLIAAVFFFGREKLIPKMFLPIVNTLERVSSDFAPSFKYYLQRHVEVDGHDHSVKAEKLLMHLCEHDSGKILEAISVSKEALELRKMLWDGALSEIKSLSFSQ